MPNAKELRQLKGPLATDTFHTSRNAVAQADAFAAQYVSHIDAGAVSYEGLFRDVLCNFYSYREIVILATATPGLNEAAQREYGNATIDYVAWLTTFEAALVDCLAWLESNWPQDPAIGMRLQEFTGDGFGGTRAPAATDAAWLAALRDKLAAVQVAGTPTW